MTYTKEYKESMQKYINSLLEKENRDMSNTTNFEKALGKKMQMWEKQLLILEKI